MSEHRYFDGEAGSFGEVSRHDLGLRITYNTLEWEYVIECEDHVGPYFSVTT